MVDLTLEARAGVLQQIEEHTDTKPGSCYTIVMTITEEGKGCDIVSMWQNQGIKYLNLLT